MVSIFKFFNKEKSEEIPDYIEIDVGKEEKQTKLLLKPFVLKNFADTSAILESLREGNTIALIDIKELKKRDIVELKRAIAKIKKTVDALEGNIAGFGDNTIVATPSFIEIYRPRTQTEAKEAK